MQLFIHITNHEASIPVILTKLMDTDIHGATVVDCKGMLTAIRESSVEPPPIFGSLRELLSPQQETGKMLFIALRDEDVPAVKDIIHSVAGNLKQPNTGVLFTVPIMNWEGVSHR